MENKQRANRKMMMNSKERSVKPEGYEWLKKYTFYMLTAISITSFAVSTVLS
jgi:hypothetical protein